MSKETYEITKEAVLKAAKECPDWERGLKAMFPKAFEEEDKYFDLEKRTEFRPILRALGKYRGKAYILSGQVEWEIKHDESDALCLIPTRKDT